MESSFLFKGVGVVLAIAGVALVSNPELVSSKPIPEDIFEAIERRRGQSLGLGGTPGLPES